MPSYKSVARHTGSSSASVLNILNNFNVMTMQRDRHSAKSTLPPGSKVTNGREMGDTWWKLCVESLGNARP